MEPKDQEKGLFPMRAGLLIDDAKCRRCVSAKMACERRAGDKHQIDCVSM